MKAKVELEAYGSLCSLQTFTINGIEAEEEEFVEKYDHCPDEAEDYGCGDMRAEIIEASENVLERYKISIEDYNEIAEKVSELVSFGSCGWCV